MDPGLASKEIAHRFAMLAARREGALVAYLTAGDPDLPRSADYLRAVLAAGADVLELGVPFSDPMADGPTLQRASERALRAGATLRGVLDLAQMLRRTSDTPIVLFGYANPFLAYGAGRLAADAAAAGVNGLLVVDLPPEEAEELSRAVAASGLDLIRFLAPTTPAARILKIAAQASGFLYYVSRTGVTGAALQDLGAVRAGVLGARRVVDATVARGLPLCVGFGLSTADEVSRVCTFAEGAVVGSALVRRVEEGASPEAVAAFVRTLKVATRAAPDGGAGGIGAEAGATLAHGGVRGAAPPDDQLTGEHRAPRSDGGAGGIGAGSDQVSRAELS